MACHNFWGGAKIVVVKEGGWAAPRFLLILNINKKRLVAHSEPIWQILPFWLKWVGQGREILSPPTLPCSSKSTLRSNPGGTPPG